MKQLMSVGVIVFIDVILVVPEVLLLSPVLNALHVDINIGVITILLTVWLLLRDWRRLTDVAPITQPNNRRHKYMRYQKIFRLITYLI